MRRSNALIPVFAIGLTLASVPVPSRDAQADEMPKVVNIGSQRELFVDRHMIGQLKGASLKLHTPQLMPSVCYAMTVRATSHFEDCLLRSRII